MNKKSIPPRPANVLYENLFHGRHRESVLDLVSQGLLAFAQNADWLLYDAKVLLDAKRYARAASLVATADEEIAKSYVLLDACRLDFTSQESSLKPLCAAFYDHVAKYAYNKITRADYLRNLKQAGEMFQRLYAVPFQG